MRKNNLPRENDTMELRDLPETSFNRMFVILCTRVLGVMKEERLIGLR